MPYFFQGELLLFSMVRAHWIDVGGMSTGFGAGARSPIPGWKGCSSTSSSSTRPASSTRCCSRCITRQHPLSRILARRPALADRGLPPRRCAALDELFERYGRDTMLAAIAQIFDETEARCRNVVADIPDGVYEAESFIDDDGVDASEPSAASMPRSRSTGGDMTIDLSGCSKERAARHQLRARSPARASPTRRSPRRSSRSTKARSARSTSSMPEGNIMMARYPAPMAGWSRIAADRRRHHRRGAGAGDAGRMPGGASRRAGRRRHLLRRRSARPASASSLQSIEGGGWGGRPHEDGESASSRSARATCATARSRRSS